MARRPAVPAVGRPCRPRGRLAGEEWFGVTFDHHGANRVTDRGMDRYSQLAATMNTTPGAEDAVRAELMHRGRVITFRAA
jgi:hypothetical protein